MSIRRKRNRQSINDQLNKLINKKTYDEAMKTYYREVTKTKHIGYTPTRYGEIEILEEHGIIKFDLTSIKKIDQRLEIVTDCKVNTNDYPIIKQYIEEGKDISYIISVNH